MRDEVNALGIAADQPTTFDNLEAMQLTEMAFKEAMRLKPPVPSIPRRAIRDFTFMGYAIPAGTMLGVNPLFTHHMPEIWPDPEKFDPMRFTDEAQRNRHRFAWVPFGGGAHMCLGLHFAYMQAKCFARHFLQNLERLAGARLHAGLADVADPEAARRIAGDAEAGCLSRSGQVGSGQTRSSGASMPTTSMPSARPRIGSRPRSRTANGGAEPNRSIAARDARKPPSTLRLSSSSRAAVFMTSPLKTMARLTSPISPMITGPKCRLPRIRGATPNSRCNRARCARQLIAHRHEAAQRAAIDRAAALRPGHDHLVADIIEDFAAIVHDGKR